MKNHKYLKSKCGICHSPLTIPNPKWLREVRLSSGIEQKRIAEKAKVRPAYICDIEHGRKRCRNKRVLKIYEDLSKKVSRYR